MKRIAGIVGLVLLAASCAVGPRYEAPGVEAPDRFAAADAEPAGSTSDPAVPADEAVAIDGAWWGSLGDPLLVAYVERAVAANHDARAARARVREARAVRGVAVGRLRPRVDAGGGVSRSRASGEGVGAAQLADVGLVALENDAYDLGFDASWEIDVFGGNRRGVEAATARLGAAVEARRGVLLSVAAEVARSYVELRGAQRRLEVARRNIRVQEDSLRRVRDKHDAGLAPRLDVHRARALVETSRARVPPIGTAIRAHAHRLAVLTGRLPSDVLEELLAVAPVPLAPAAVASGVPSELARRRPDVRGAERALHAATADVGVAVADLFPRIRIGAGGGVESASSGSLFRASARTWSIGASLLAPVFQGGRIRANIEAARARNELAFVRYEQVVLVALEEVETSLVKLRQRRAEHRELRAATESTARAAELADVLYRRGLTDYLAVLDAERSLIEIEDRLVASETAAVVSWIALYKALGGGWDEFESGPGTGTPSVSG